MTRRIQKKRNQKMKVVSLEPLRDYVSEEKYYLGWDNKTPIGYGVYANSKDEAIELISMFLKTDEGIDISNIDWNSWEFLVLHSDFKEETNGL